MARNILQGSVKVPQMSTCFSKTNEDLHYDLLAYVFQNSKYIQISQYAFVVEIRTGEEINFLYINYGTQIIYVGLVEYKWYYAQIFVEMKIWSD